MDRKNSRKLVKEDNLIIDGKEVLLNFLEINDIDYYLGQDYPRFYYQILKELTEDSNWKNIFNPLNFFNLLNNEYFIVHNVIHCKPTLIVKRINDHNFTQEQQYYFLYHFIRFHYDIKRHSAITIPYISYLMDEFLKIHDNIPDQYKFKLRPSGKSFKSSVIQNKKGIKNEEKNKPVCPQTFEELFNYPELTLSCIDVLKVVKPPILTNANVYALGSKSKGSLVAWIAALKYKGFLKKNLPDSLIASMLNTNFADLNLGKDGRTLRNPNTTAYKKYYNEILNLLPDLPLSTQGKNR